MFCSTCPVSASLSALKPCNAMNWPGGAATFLDDLIVPLTYNV